MGSIVTPLVARVDAPLCVAAEQQTPAVDLVDAVACKSTRAWAAAGVASSRWAPLPDGPPEARGDVDVDAHAVTLDLHPRDPAMLERKDAYRRRYKPAREMCGTGNRPGSIEALLAAKLPLVLCGREGCCALVQLHAVRRAARAARRDFEPGDGCSARSCIRRYRPTRFTATQRRWVAQLLADERPLAVRPTTSAQLHAELITGDRLIAAAHTALAALQRAD